MSSIFDVTEEDIQGLDDSDSRELVGRLCEAELGRRGLSTVAVTYGGDQRAPDGGVDVKVSLSALQNSEGYIPAASTGYQVKAEKMGRSMIATEMRPGGKLRPAIQELANESGAYVIVSTRDSVTDSKLRDRRNAMRGALYDAENADRLQVDFYDCKQLAKWVRCHPGVIAWVKDRIGRNMSGWHPYGSWCGAAQDVQSEYLLDHSLRLHFGLTDKSPGQKVVDSIDSFRDQLRAPGSVVRLVGLSGVGKTRLAQALFDVRIGSRALPPSLAVYVDMADEPNPEPIQLASHLIANVWPAILIVDNCSPELHGRLAHTCKGDRSTISVLSIEYDVREDIPEGTDVVTLEPSSIELIGKLLRNRFPRLSLVDAQRISEVSGGNARVAIVLAETVRHTDSLAGLTDAQLFERLFWQRQSRDDALLRAAEVCSLVYSFDGEGDELSILARLAEQTPATFQRNVGKLLERQLAQRRGRWRAILPHAIANRMAVRALGDVPREDLDRLIVQGNARRLLRSFSRRLSYLHDCEEAVAIAKRWLGPEGLLGNIADLDDDELAMFMNVAPLSPDDALKAIERAGRANPGRAMSCWSGMVPLIRGLAYDPALFERSAEQLASIALSGNERRPFNAARDAFTSFFSLHLSGTHATLDQRLALIDTVYRSTGEDGRKLALSALDQMLESVHFSAGHDFSFGARSRDFGYDPEGPAQVRQWYIATLKKVEELASRGSDAKAELRALLARRFRGLWGRADIQNDVEATLRRLVGNTFCSEAWVAVRNTIYFGREMLPPEVLARLTALAQDLQPCGLSDWIEVVVIGTHSIRFELSNSGSDEGDSDGVENLWERAASLGAEAASRPDLYSSLFSKLLRGGLRVTAFGSGLAKAAKDPRQIWGEVISIFATISPQVCDFRLLQGFLSGIAESDAELAMTLLDAADECADLSPQYPALISAVGLDARGVARLKQKIETGIVSIEACRELLSHGSEMEKIQEPILCNLLRFLLSRPGGGKIVCQILWDVLNFHIRNKRVISENLKSIGREVLKLYYFERNSNDDGEYHIAEISKICLKGREYSEFVTDIVKHLRFSVDNGEESALYNSSLLTALIEIHPGPVLDAFLGDNGVAWNLGVSLFNGFDGFPDNPANALPTNELLDWCQLDPERRFPIAASIIVFAVDEGGDKELKWSDQAIEIIKAAPHAKAVIEVFARRFAPNSWSGSRAMIIEKNAWLLDSLPLEMTDDLLEFLGKVRLGLSILVRQERKSELARSRVVHERFE